MAANIERLYDFMVGNVIQSEEVDGELNQIIARLKVIDGDNLSDATCAALAVSDLVSKRRGLAVNTATDSRTNTAYGLMPAPDLVSGIVMPTDGLITVGYQATWANSVAIVGRAAIFLNDDQVKQARLPSPAAQSASGASAGVDVPLYTVVGGLVSHTGGTPYTGDVTTGQVVGGYDGFATGGVCCIFAAAGTYDVSIRFAATSGSVSVKNRKLWVKSESYA